MEQLGPVMRTRRVHKYGRVTTQALGCMRALPRQWLKLHLQLLCGRRVAGCREQTLRKVSDPQQDSVIGR